VRWSKQITSALIHIRDQGTVFSDLRLDNVVLASSNNGAHFADAVLIDFEQRGNWYEWCAPEVRYRMYVDNLRNAMPGHDFSSEARTPQAVNDFLESFEKHGQISALLQDNPGRGKFPIPPWNQAWFSLSPAAQEKAMTFSLGMFLYCIFEGVSNPCISVANAWPFEPHIEFPHFQRTPSIIRTLVQQLTIDAPEWSYAVGLPRGSKRMARRGDKIFAATEVGDFDQHDNRRFVINEAILGWEEELHQAQAYYESRDWVEGISSKSRPGLSEVLHVLESFEADDLLCGADSVV
jgi:hypothetical protein